MLKGVHTTPRNRYTCKIFMDNDLISRVWGGEIFSLLIKGALQNIIEKRQLTLRNFGATFLFYVNSLQSVNLRLSQVQLVL